MSKLKSLLDFIQAEPIAHNGEFLSLDCAPYYDELEFMQKELETLRTERDALLRWKTEMLQVESQWDPQEVAKLLQIRLGANVRVEIQPKIEGLLSRKDELAKALVNVMVNGVEGITYNDLCRYQDLLTKIKE